MPGTCLRDDILFYDSNGRIPYRNFGQAVRKCMNIAREQIDIYGMFKLKPLCLDFTYNSLQRRRWPLAAFPDQKTDRLPVLLDPFEYDILA